VNQITSGVCNIINNPSGIDSVQPYSPDKGDGYLVLGKVYMKLGNYEKAISILKKALLLFKKDKKKSDIYTLLGISYFKFGEYTKAMRNFNEALILNSENETARINLDITRETLRKEIRQ
jgi:tetratricopeptide (TPR) repeat protein